MEICIVYWKPKVKAQEKTVETEVKSCGLRYGDGWCFQQFLMIVVDLYYNIYIICIYIVYLQYIIYDTEYIIFYK